MDMNLIIIPVMLIFECDRAFHSNMTINAIGLIFTLGCDAYLAKLKVRIVNLCGILRFLIGTLNLNNYGSFMKVQTECVVKHFFN